MISPLQTAVYFPMQLMGSRGFTPGHRNREPLSAEREFWVGQNPKKCLLIVLFMECKERIPLIILRIDVGGFG